MPPARGGCCSPSRRQQDTPHLPVARGRLLRTAVLSAISDCAPSEVRAPALLWIRFELAGVTRRARAKRASPPKGNSSLPLTRIPAEQCPRPGLSFGSRAG